MGMTGAGALVCRAAQRSGTGVVTWAIPASQHPVAAALSVETITLAVPSTPAGAPAMEAREYLLEAAREASAVALGSGLPVAGETGELIRLLIPEIYAPMVVDAGGLTAIGGEWMILKKRKSPTVLTPHPGEMGRLVNKSAEDVQAARQSLAAKYAKATGTVVLLKGKDTVVSDGARTVVNTTGNPGMATAGSGDVLTGVIAALLSQGMDAFDAARLGAHLHGLAGDIAAHDLGVHGMIASDMVERLPAAFLRYAGERLA